MYERIVPFAKSYMYKIHFYKFCWLFHSFKRSGNLMKRGHYLETITTVLLIISAFTMVQSIHVLGKVKELEESIEDLEEQIQMLQQRE